MKKFYQKCLFICSLLLVSQSSYAGLILSTNNVTVTQGESFSLDLILQLDAGQTFTGFGLNLDFTNATNIELDTIDYPSWLIEDSLNDISGSVDFFGPIISGPNEFTLATLNFTALNAGSAELLITGADGGIFEGLFYDDFSFEDVDLTLNTQVTSVAEPGSIGLIFFAMIALLFMHKQSNRSRA